MTDQALQPAHGRPDASEQGPLPGFVPDPRRRPLASWVSFGVTMTLLIGSTVALFLPLVPQAIGGAACIMMLCLIFLRVPIAIAMILPSLIALYSLRGILVVETMLSSLAFRQVSSWTLSVVPMFILMGLLLWRAGLTESIFTACRHWVGWLPGGLAVGTNLAGTGLASVSGSTLGTTYAISRIGIPEMLKAGYDKRFAMVAIVGAGLGGQLIPPSLLLVIYAGIAEVPVGPQLLAGIGPGILIAVMVTIVLIIAAAVWPRLTVPEDAAGDLGTVTWNDRFGSLLKVWPIPFLVGLIVWGMFSGVFTATEAGAAAALFALVIALIWKRKSNPFGVVREAAVGTIAAVGAIFLILIGAGALSQMLVLTQLSPGFARFIDSADFGRVQFLLLMMVVYIALGMFMDTLTMMVLTVPVLLPTLAALEISPIWFGVFVVFMGELGMVTPPIGILSFIIHGIAKEPEVNQGQRVDLKDVFVAVGWIMPLAILITILLILFPGLVTYIPDMAAGSE